MVVDFTRFLFTTYIQDFLYTFFGLSHEIVETTVSKVFFGLFNTRPIQVMYVQ